MDAGFWSEFMLSKLRDYSSYFLWFVVITFVGFMAFSGVQECGSEPYQRGIIAEINGQPISLAVYNNAVQRAVQNRQQDGQELSDDQLSGIREQAWQQLVGALLMDQETAKRGITVSDEELANYLRNYPPQDLQQQEAFQTDGKFDYQKYIAAMSNTTPQVTQFWKSVESYWRPQLRQSKLQQEVISTVRVTDREIEDYFHENNDLARVEFLLLSSASYNKDVGEPEEDSLIAFYNQEKPRYMRNERVNMEMLIWNRQPSEADKEWAHQQILDVKKQLDEGANFEDLAAQYSMDGTAANGGDLGWFGKGTMVKPFEEAAYALKPGEISGPVETQFGWHIIKLEETRPDPNKKGETQLRARHILIRPEVSQQTTDSIYSVADEFSLMVRDGQTEFSKESATALGALYFEARGTQHSDNIANIGPGSNIKAWAFSAEPGEVSGPISDGGKFVVARLKSRHPRGVASFDEVRNLVLARYITHRARVLAKPAADSIYAEATAGTPLKDFGERNDAVYQLTDKFSRSTNVPQVGKSPIFMGTVFATSLDDPWAGPVPVENGWAIIHLLEKDIADESAMAPVRDSLAGTILRQKQNDVYTQWFVDVYQNADIRDYRSEALGSSF